MLDAAEGIKILSSVTGRPLNRVRASLLGVMVVAYCSDLSDAAGSRALSTSGEVIKEVASPLAEEISDIVVVCCSELSDAAGNGTLSRCVELIEEGANPNFQDGALTLSPHLDCSIQRAITLCR